MLKSDLRGIETRELDAIKNKMVAKLKSDLRGIETR